MALTFKYDPETVNMNHIYGRTSMPNIQVKGNFVLKLLFGHIDTHTPDQVI